MTSVEQRTIEPATARNSSGTTTTRGTVTVNGSDRSSSLKEHDVVCEKGRGDHERWPGNKLYRYLISIHKDSYNELTPMERSTVIGQIIGAIKEKDGGAWFVQNDVPTMRWVPLSEEKVRKKVSDDLRREVRRKREKRSSSSAFCTKLKAMKELEEQQQQQQQAGHLGASAVLAAATSEILQPVDDPRPTDVLFGPGARRHPGNKTYWQTMKRNLDQYIISPYGARSMISRGIVQGIQADGGRFLEQDPKTAIWYEIRDKRAIDKTSHALSNKKYKTRRRIIVGSTTSSSPAPQQQQEQQPTLSPHSMMGVGSNAAAAAGYEVVFDDEDGSDCASLKSDSSVHIPAPPPPPSVHQQPTPQQNPLTPSQKRSKKNLLMNRMSGAGSWPSDTEKEDIASAANTLMTQFSRRTAAAAATTTTALKMTATPVAPASPASYHKSPIADDKDRIVVSPNDSRTGSSGASLLSEASSTRTYHEIQDADAIPPPPSDHHHHHHHHGMVMGGGGAFQPRARKPMQPVLEGDASEYGSMYHHPHHHQRLPHLEMEPRLSRYEDPHEEQQHRYVMMEQQHAEQLIKGGMAPPPPSYYSNSGVADHRHHARHPPPPHRRRMLPIHGPPRGMTMRKEEGGGIPEYYYSPRRGAGPPRGSGAGVGGGAGNNGYWVEHPVNAPTTSWR